MQKVSKQSLAMLALSILLAISIALTFTFAAASVSKTAQGTITFTGSYAVAWTGGTESEGNITFTLAETCFDVTASGAKLNASLNETGKTALAAYSVTFTNATSKVAAYTVTEAQTSSDTGTIDITLKNDTADVNANSAVTKTLADLISDIQITEATGAEIVFTITATLADKA